MHGPILTDRLWWQRPFGYGLSLAQWKWEWDTPPARVRENQMTISEVSTAEVILTQSSPT